MNKDEDALYFSEKLSQSSPFRWGHFKPFLIRLELGSPVAVTIPWISLEGLISHLLLMSRLREDYFITPRKKNLTPIFNKYGFSSPLRQTESLFHASVSQFEPSSIRCTKIYKRFEEKWTEKLKKQKIRVGQGHFRAYMMNEPYIPARRVIFYACGDMEGIQRLIQENVFAIGNDYRIGFGAVRDISFEETPTDWSLVKEGKAMRPLPTKYCEEWDDEAWLPAKAPYWEPRNVELCVPPGAHVRMKAKFTNFDLNYLRRSER